MSKGIYYLLESYIAWYGGSCDILRCKLCLELVLVTIVAFIEHKTSIDQLPIKI